MLKRRDFVLMLWAALVGGGVVAMAQSAKTKDPAMHSAAIEWSSIDPKPSATGSSRKFFEGPSPTLALLECHASTLNPGAQNHEILKRTHDEVIIVKEGTLEVYVGDKWVKLGPGSVIFNAANADQAMRNPGPTPATYHVVTFQPAQLPDARPAN
jgi:hypothetical protein